MDNIISQIVRIVFNQLTQKIEEITGKGEANLVYKIQVGDLFYILRMGKGEYSEKTYQKEKWCMEKVSQKGIPTSKSVAIGMCDKYVYSIQEYIEGEHGADIKGSQEKIWLKLGEYARIINTIEVKGYGENLKNPENDDFGNDWKSVVDWSIDYLFENDFFIKNKILTEDQVEKIKIRISEMYKWDFKAFLTHGNLAPKNTIVHPSGVIYLIDWGTAGAYRVPHFELSDLYTWDPKQEYIEAFLKGYGLSGDEVANMKHDLDTLVILRLMDSIRWAADKREDWREVSFVKHSLEKLNKIYKE